MKVFNCVDCLGDLEDLGGVHADLWLDLCQLASNDLHVTVKEDNGLKYELRWLEELGFIVTRETNELVQIRLEGDYVIGDSLCFCIDLEAHG